MKLGDTVEIVNIDRVYTTYETMAIKLGLPNYHSDKNPPAGGVGTVVGLGKHSYTGAVCVGVRCAGFDYIVAKEGLRLSSSSPEDLTKIDKLFGELCRSTQVALFDAWLDGEDIECNYLRGSKDNPQWRSGYIYRVKKDNTEEITKIRKEMEKLTERLEELEV